MDKREIRKEAVRRHVMGEPVAAICRGLDVSRKWFYKWYHCYQTGADDWFDDRSRAPKRQARRVPSELEELVLRVRDELKETKYAQVGAIAIAWRISRLGITPPPLWTINRILKRNDRIQPRPKSRRAKSGVNYPYFLEASYPGHIHQADLVGPRYLKGDGRFYCFSAVGRFSHMVHCVPLRSKDDDTIVDALTEVWRQIGVPDILQLDNELSFLGSNRYPHCLGKVLKLCLSLGMQPVFIPVGEPWRNGVVERFNETFDESFYRIQRFEDYEHLKAELRQFLIFHNHNHVYSANRGKTPIEMVEASEVQPELLCNEFAFCEEATLPYESFIHFIRFVRSDLKLNIRGEIFPMPNNLMYQYVRATIFTECHQLSVFLGNQFVETFEYPLPNFNREEAKP